MGTITRSTPAPAPAAWDARRVLRLLLVAALAWLTVKLVRRPLEGCVLDLVNLAFHEAGHVFATPFGRTVHFLGGTFGQLLVPGLLVWYFLARREDAFAAAVCAWWTGENLLNVAAYMADARDLELPLVGGGEHDWNELFFRFGMLDADSVARVSATTRGLGFVLMTLGLAWAATFLLPAASRGRLIVRVAGAAPWAVRLLED